MRRVGTSGGKQGEGGTVKRFGVFAFLVHCKRESEVGGRLAFEPSRRHVEED